MNIGIIIDIKTGHPMAIAKKLKEMYEAKGHNVEIRQLVARNKPSRWIKVTHLKEVPDIDGYDVVVLGFPVQSMQISPVMHSFLNHTMSFQNKELFCFVTHLIPLPWMGGFKVLQQVRLICMKKHANMRATAVVNWSNKTRAEQEAELLERFTKI